LTIIVSEETGSVSTAYKGQIEQTKGQLMKNLNTAFSFAPPSILSLTITMRKTPNSFFNIFTTFLSADAQNK
ncbi:MAG TPA: hypothetical protein DHW25_01655, partial [Blautia sp.]|nr:hypothetical protein [Blautia sp.]